MGWRGPCCEGTGQNQNRTKPGDTRRESEVTGGRTLEEGTNTEYELRVLQFNINGLNNKWEVLIAFLKENNIKIAAIQETKLTEKSKLGQAGDFTLIRKDRGHNKGGGTGIPCRYKN